MPEIQFRFFDNNTSVYYLIGDVVVEDRKHWLVYDVQERRGRPSKAVLHHISMPTQEQKDAAKQFEARWRRGLGE